ncbi:unnamed protein product [Sphagnum troendelagicum]|uniref:Histidine-containing phosphotransfer protein n=1 Tax=Sphagnum troendelagicum TaxID=128251 RepID=A0ABP0TAD2_9BRYO
MGKSDKAAASREEEAMQLAAAKQEYAEHMDSLRAEGLLDDQFLELQQLQDESSPDFVEEVVLLFIQDSGRIIQNLTDSLEQTPVNFKKVDAHVHQFKGSSSSIGAKRVKAVCIILHMCCDREDQQGCLFALEHVKREFDLIKGKLQTMLKLEKQIIALGGTPPFEDKL